MKSTRWAHLPVAGGWYDQHPQLIDDFQTIMAVEAKVEKQKRDREERNKGRTLGQGRRRGRR